MLKVKKDNIYNVTGDINMKITKQRLKEIIKEELENSKNEADQIEEIDLGKAASAIGQMVKGRLFRVGTKHYDYYEKQLLSMAKAGEHAQDEEDKKMLQLSRERYRQEQKDRERRKEDDERMARARKEIEREYNEKRWAKDSADRERNRSRSPIDVSGRSSAYGDNRSRSWNSVREGKITKDALKSLITEELAKVKSK